MRLRQRHILASFLVFAWLSCGPSAAETAAPVDAAGRIIGSALTGDGAYVKLTHLSDRIGHRLSGSSALERAVAWAARDLERGGHRVWTEMVMVPHWVRGREAARIVSPIERAMPLLALGGSVGTPIGGLEAEVVVVDGFEQLTLLGEAVQGKIVLYNLAMEAGFDADPGYGTVVRLRGRGASEAAKLGAVGMLIRSLGTADYRLPHTGALDYTAGVEQIPAAAITAEDAELIRRLTEAGDAVRVQLELGARWLPDAASANVLAEIRGRELPEEIVLIGAHLDSWDVGDGAHDDGAGCVVVMETLDLIRRLRLTPRRTLRAVLFTNEENGLRGGKDYAARHMGEHHVAAIEMDGGAFAPVGFGVTAGEGGVAMVEAISTHLAALGADRVFPRGGGADISPLRKRGVPVMGLIVDPTRYFDYHHSAADTLDKVDPAELRKNVAVMAWMAWSLAEQVETLPRIPLEGE